jgi:hypothetical protein
MTLMRQDSAARKRGELKRTVGSRRVSSAIDAQRRLNTLRANAEGLNLNPGSVATRLTQLAKAGEIKKASRGYSTEQATQTRSHQRPPGHSH